MWARSAATERARLAVPSLLAVFAKHVVHPERSGKNGVATQPFNPEEAPDEAPSSCEEYTDVPISCSSAVSCSRTGPIRPQRSGLGPCVTSVKCLEIVRNSRGPRTAPPLRDAHSDGGRSGSPPAPHGLFVDTVPSLRISRQSSELTATCSR